MGRHRQSGWRLTSVLAPSVSLLALLALITFAVVGLVPSVGSTLSPKKLTGARAKPAKAPLAPSSPLVGTPFTGTPAVGALFLTDASGNLTAQHFCTASVVDSPERDLIITAAHCVDDGSHQGMRIAYVPGYHDGKQPYGAWTAVKAFIDDKWSASSDQAHDVAFLRVQRSTGSARIQDVTGANTLGVGRSPGVVRVIGYPSDQDQPIGCQNTLSHTAGQYEFDCKNYNSGTSGGPFLADVDPSTGRGTVVGVIGGLHYGGDDPDVSYSITFDDVVKSLYDTATAAHS